MKTIIALLVSLCSMTISLCAKENIITCAKTYVKPNQMFFTESALYVEIEDMWIQPAALKIDTNGFYFTTLQPTPGPWQCQKRGCTKWNDEYRDVCQKCGTPRSRPSY